MRARAGRWVRLAVVMMVAGWGLAGCAAPQPPEPESVAAREGEAAKAAAAATAAEQEAEAARQEEAAPRRREEEPVRQTVVVLDPGGAPKPKTPRELAEASRRDRALHGDRSVGEITDANLAELAAQGKVTYAGGGAPGDETTEAAAGEGAEPGEEAADAASAGAETGEEPCGEACWRRRAYELREGWSRSVAEIEELEAEAAELRWRFYAEDDPWVRDGQVKPAWDRALDRLRRAHDEAERYRERLGELLEEGRRAGALPGWLREGIELEPESAETEDGRDPAEPAEPQVLEDDAAEPRQH